MYLLGQADPTLTMRVYQEVLDMGGAAVEALEGVVGCTIQEAFVTYVVATGRSASRGNSDTVLTGALR